MRVVNFSEARNHLKSVLDHVVEDADYTIISRRDADDAVVMSLDSFNGLMEMVHLLKSPANAIHFNCYAFKMIDSWFMFWTGADTLGVCKDRKSAISHATKYEKAQINY